MRLNPFAKYETKRVAEEMKMYIGEKLRELRESKALSQGEIEKRTGLLRVYISRVENGHTVPAIETLEKLARALEVPLYHLFYEGEQPPKVLAFPKLRLSDDTEWGNSGTDARYLRKLRRLLARMNDGDRRLLLLITEKMTRTRSSETGPVGCGLGQEWSIVSLSIAKNSPAVGISWNLSSAGGRDPFL